MKDTLKVQVGAAELDDGTFQPQIQVKAVDFDVTFTADKVLKTENEALAFAGLINSLFTKVPIRSAYDRNGKADLI